MTRSAGWHTLLLINRFNLPPRSHVSGLVELAVISWIRNRYMDTSLSAGFKSLSAGFWCFSPV